MVEAVEVGTRMEEEADSRVVEEAAWVVVEEEGAGVADRVPSSHLANL